MNLLSRVLLAVVPLMLCACAGERPQTIENPAYDFKTSGITNVVKVEHAEDETLITVKTTFLPNWWVKFPKETFIEIPETGERLFITSMENGEIGSHIFMGPSGDSTFILHFPPLAENVRTINYGENEDTEVYGLSLVNPKKEAAEARIPARAERWLKKELGASKKKTIWDLSSDTFFEDGTARVVGYIKGYDPRMGFRTGIIYQSNEITNEDYPRVVEIHPDGRFEVDIPVLHPQRQNMYIEKFGASVPIYIEPGQTLAVILDWEDFLYADRNRNRQCELESTEYRGPAARINQELASYKDLNTDWDVFQKQYKEMYPQEYRTWMTEKWDNDIAELESYAVENGILPATKALIIADIDMANGERMFDYVMYREYENTEATKAPVPQDFYDFMKRMDLNNPANLVSSNADIFLNRFEYSAPFRGTWKPVSVDVKDFCDYLVEDKGVDPNDKELTAYFNTSQKFMEMLGTGKISQADYFNSKELKDSKQTLQDKYPQEYEEHSKLSKEAWEAAGLKEDRGRMARIDSIMVNHLGLTPSLITQTVNARRISQSFGEYSAEGTAEYLAELKKYVPNEFLAAQMDVYYDEKYNNTGPKPIPDNTAGRTFKKIIDPYKGKVLLVDFWGVYCGPCVYGIEQSVELRKQYSESEDIEFLFLTSDGESPLDKYNEIVEKNGMAHSFRLTADDYLYLRELFRFNGIPRYVLIDREGRIVDGNAASPYSKSQIEEYINDADGMNV